MLRKTKIVCTIGPACERLDMLKALLHAGMDVARLNFSHGNHITHKCSIDMIRAASSETNKVVAILLDTKGPEIRTGDVETGSILLEKGKEVAITTESILGTSERFSILYDKLFQIVHIGTKILLDDGGVTLQVLQVGETAILCEVLHGGVLGSKKGVNIPGADIVFESMTETDARDIHFAIDNQVDFIAASFIREAKDVLAIRDILNKEGSNIKLISKIENRAGIQNIEEILEVSDGIMVARGDLGVEIPIEEVPLVQKDIISRCNRLGKVVITATQMLDSMQRNFRPTRAEASDVANSILDGTDAIMLSGETAVGKYPLESVNTMSRIAVQTEAALKYQDVFYERMRETEASVTDSISQAVVHASHRLKCKAIIAATESGQTVQMISKYRPQVPIIAITPHEDVMRKCALIWGVQPVLGTIGGTTDEMFRIGIVCATTHQFVVRGDLVIITAGVPLGRSGSTNLLKVHVIGEPL